MMRTYLNGARLAGRAVHRERRPMNQVIEDALGRAAAPFRPAAGS